MYIPAVYITVIFRIGESLLIITLTAATQELHEMFYDMALLVEEQGEMIDRIEHNVENAAVHVQTGKNEIRTAVQFQAKNRRVS